MDTEKPSYYAIFPANVRYDKRLRPYERILYAEITALTNKTGECWASNNYFAKLYDVTPRVITLWINDLVKYGYINVKYEYKGKQVIRRIITLTEVLNICSGGGEQKFTRGTEQKFQENNINTNNIKLIYSKQQRQSYNDNTLLDNPDELFDN